MSESPDEEWVGPVTWTPPPRPELPAGKTLLTVIHDDSYAGRDDWIEYWVLDQPPSLPELQAFVGGYIEMVHVPMADGTTGQMICNEDPRAKAPMVERRPMEYNSIAVALLSRFVNLGGLGTHLIVEGKLLD